MVDLLAARGIHDPVLAAFGRVRREAFVPPAQREHAHDDHPLPIGWGQTISQPWIVADMLQSLRLQAGERVLDIGTGSGYQAALLAELGARVWTVECVPELAAAAKERLASLGYPHIRTRQGDGRLGWAEAAPFDAIVAAAQTETVPPAWLAQLHPQGGRLILPLGRPGVQDLRLIVRHGERYEHASLGGCMFVPLV